MTTSRPGRGKDRRFKYFLAASFMVHAIFLSSVFFYRLLVPETYESAITISLGMPGGGGAVKGPAKKAPPVIRKKEKMALPSKTAPKEKPEEQANPATATTQQESASGSGQGTGQGTVSSNELDNQPELVKFNDPVYPLEARRKGVEGVVLLKALIEPDGKIKEVKVLKSIPMLDKAAIAAVRQWRFSALTSRGRPVYVWMIIPIRFQLK